LLQSDRAVGAIALFCSKERRFFLDSTYAGPGLRCTGHIEDDLSADASLFEPLVRAGDITKRHA